MVRLSFDLPFLAALHIAFWLYEPVPAAYSVDEKLYITIGDDCFVGSRPRRLPGFSRLLVKVEIYVQIHNTESE